MKKLFLLFTTASLLLGSYGAKSAPNVVNGVATFSKNEQIGTRCKVKASWREIVIKKGVTLRGSFYIEDRNSDLLIRGEDKNTSIIEGIKNNKSESEAAIHKKNGTGYLTVNKLKIRNSDGRGIMCWGSGGLTVNNCKIIESRDLPWSDGIHANGTAVIKNCWIDVFDDATYLPMTSRIENTTIVHRKNGAAFQVSWGGDKGTGHKTVISNCKVIDAGNTYNCAVVAWVGKNNSDFESVDVEFINFKRETKQGFKSSPMFQFGSPNRPEKVVNNATIFVKGWATDKAWTVRYNKSNGRIKSLKSASLSEEVPNLNHPRLGIYPNPASNVCFINEVEKNTVVTFYNISGKQVKQTTATTKGSLKIDISNLKKGIYIATINTKDKKSFKQKLIIQ